MVACVSAVVRNCVYGALSHADDAETYKRVSDRGLATSHW